MADVSVDASISASSARGMRAVCFLATDALIGYHFLISSTGEFGYRKTTNGGASWGAFVSLGIGTETSFDIWPDWWTPGNTGTVINTWTVDTTFDDVTFAAIDTAAGDAIITTAPAALGASAVAGRGAFISGTRGANGDLWCAFDIDAGAEKGLTRSTDNGATWGASVSATFVEATLDECLLFPAMNTGDTADVLAVYLDASATALTLKMWDSSGAVAGESATIQAHLLTAPASTDLTGQHGYSASIRHSDGKLILAAVSDYDTVTADHQVWELDCTGPAAFTVTAKTDITTNIDDHYYPMVFINQFTNDIYVAYNGARAGSETLGATTKVYFTKSVDGGATWSAGDTAYMEGAAAAAIQTFAPPLGPRLYVSWRIGTTLVGNFVNSLTFGAPPPVVMIIPQSRVALLTIL